MLKFTIPLQPRTKKNSQQILINKKTGRPFVSPSKYYKAYQIECRNYVPTLKEPISEPVNLKAIFYMPTRRRVDLVNLHEALQDILVFYQILEDDNSNIVASIDGSKVEYDKNFPRTEIEITLKKEGEN